jgi:hypothetical protein
VNNIERALELLQREFPGDYIDSERVAVANKIASLMVRFAHEHANAEVLRRRIEVLDAAADSIFNAAYLLFPEGDSRRDLVEHSQELAKLNVPLKADLRAVING